MSAATSTWTGPFYSGFFDYEGLAAKTAPPSGEKRERGSHREPWELEKRFQNLIHLLAHTSPRFLEEEFLVLENSTAVSTKPELIDQAFEVIFGRAMDETFEDGKESEFSSQLGRLVGRFGNFAIEAIEDLICNRKVNAEVAAEALRWLGRMKDRQTHASRFRLLKESLSSPIPMVRDGAVLGLTSMGDRGAISSVKRAIQVEKCGELREDMKQLLDYLENGNQCLLF